MRVLFAFLINLSFVNVAFAHGMSAADRAKFHDAGLIDFAWLGAKHMITGYDHLLFLFGVIFFLTKFKSVVKFVTAFTIGHSISLIFATFLGIKIHHYVIDAVIALTVVYKGFDNIDGFKKYLNLKSPNLLYAVCVFGFIHGFGLSSRLQQVPLGYKGKMFLMKILSFNIGVEIGQIAALAVMMLLLSGWRKTESFKKFSTAANVGLMFVGSLLFLSQMHGYVHRNFTDDFQVSERRHQDLHRMMDKEFQGHQH